MAIIEPDNINLSQSWGAKFGDYYLNGYDGVTHKNVWRDDRIITQEEDQLPLLIILM